MALSSRTENLPFLVDDVWSIIIDFLSEHLHSTAATMEKTTLGDPRASLNNCPASIA
jgi:hypothetical protein